MARTIRIDTELPTSADRVWSAMQHPASFLYVTRGLLGLPALAGRTDPISQGESGRGWLFLFHVMPAWRHTLEIVEVNPDSRTIRSHEHGGILRRWDHVLHVEALDRWTCRYSDTVTIDAGPLTHLVAISAIGLYRYRQRRWHRLVRKHLLPTGPHFALPPPAPGTTRHKTRPSEP